MKRYTLEITTFIEATITTVNYLSYLIIPIMGKVFNLLQQEYLFLIMQVTGISL